MWKDLICGTAMPFCMEEAGSEGGDASSGGDTGGDAGASAAPEAGDQGSASNTGSQDWSVPEDYSEAKWAEGIQSQDDLWKKLANSQELIGKKTIAPIDYDSASPEDVAAFHKSIVPEDAGAYEFSETSDPEFSKAIVPALQEAGIHPAQLKTLEPAINKIASEMVGNQHAADRSEDGYFELTEKAFGENHKDVVVELENAYKEHLTDETKGFLDNASNAERVAFDQTVKSIMDAKNNEIAKLKAEYGAEETGLQGENGEAATNKVSIDDQIKAKRNELNELNNKAGTKDWSAIQSAKDALKSLYDIKVKQKR